MKYKNHTPEGTQDILFKQCFLKNAIDKRFMKLFKAYGYSEIETPTMEFYDVFTQGKDAIATEAMFKLYDHKGRILVLRPDMTVPIARVAATKLLEAQRSETRLEEQGYPIRISYSGRVFRLNEPSFDGQKEILQTGIELMGIKSPEADAEVIAIAVKLLLSAGFENFQIDIGQVEFFKGLMEEGSFTESETEEIRAFIDKKDMFGVEQILKEHEIDDNLREIIMNLPKYFGTIEVIKTIKNLRINERSKKAVDYLENVIEILEEYELTKYITIDLGMVQKLGYYTGIIFKGFTYGVGFPIVSGGRYDKLVEKYGKPCAAVGYSVNLNMLMTALDRQKIKIQEDEVKMIIGYSKGQRRTAFTIAEHMRARGKVAETDIENKPFEKLKQYADENIKANSEGRSIEQLIYITDQNTAVIYKPQTAETIETTVTNILDYTLDCSNESGNAATVMPIH
jgi:ATP phosphoribosyltransferase regulatory subunit